MGIISSILYGCLRIHRRSYGDDSTLRLGQDLIFLFLGLLMPYYCLMYSLVLTSNIQDQAGSICIPKLLAHEMIKLSSICMVVSGCRLIEISGLLLVKNGEHMICSTRRAIIPMDEAVLHGIHRVPSNNLDVHLVPKFCI